ncbi:MFS transporter [Georgenia wangjunii]|uniref:MFS transporter n=1 Tax=Georgenia wangjunii TaxID=3117730 RepID=UPI002F267AA5
MFLTNGAIFANLLPRYPLIKDELDLSNAAIGTAIAAFPLGALIAGLAAGTLIQRFRSSRVAVAGTLLTAVAILVAGLAPSWVALAAAMFVGGAMDAIVDVAQNAHGLRVQRLYGRSILNSFHAAWSAGAVLGGLMGSAAAGVDLDLGVHLGISGVVFCVVALAAYRFMLPGPESAERETPSSAPAGRAAPGVPGRSRGIPSRTLGILLALGVIGACAALAEDAGSSWGAIYLTGTLGAAAGAAGLAFVALQGMQFVGRILGDRMVDHFGQRTIGRAGGALTAIGMGLALAFPTTATTIAGFGLAGLGVATLIPAAMHAADEMPGLRPGAGLTVVTWLMRVGFLASPPLVGLVADAVDLRTGLLLVPLGGVVVVVLSRFLPRRPAGVPAELLGR